MGRSCPIPLAQWRSAAPGSLGRTMTSPGASPAAPRHHVILATFAGGIDYLAWKINRHAGTAITIKPWQRRWPILGAITLLPRLLSGGAVR